jgi:hypothetical protein
MYLSLLLTSANSGSSEHENIFYLALNTHPLLDDLIRCLFGKETTFAVRKAVYNLTQNKS